MSDYRDQIETMFREAGYRCVDWDDAHLWRSVKTSTERGVVDGQAFFVKVRKDACGVIATQQETYGLLGCAIPSHTGIHVPEVLICEPESGILVTEEASGRLMTTCILSSLAEPGGSRELDELSAKAGRALAIIHRYAPVGEGGGVLLYRDYSPQNLFVCGESGGITLVDPPEKMQYGEREQDLGVATVELMKQFLRSWRGMNPLVWKRCRVRFLVGYRDASGYEVDHARLAECEMAHAAKLVYLNKKYLMMKHGAGNAGKALLRASLTISLIVALKFFHLTQ
ncbi:hypothetical protein HC341_12275 [Aquisalimonas sp. 2447]|uniref:hypothetical protein n=1 Tax=Aquisalimonas sp. 2447 TaxID=2740807 RepID=UPI00143262EE|nr:hypothetical protein [Aquisalimonas sp. 2447]QIT55911.1 hypothetical protein HC341_12275 [Aquisalimonas sp. 2447]